MEHSHEWVKAVSHRLKLLQFCHTASLLQMENAILHLSLTKLRTT